MPLMRVPALERSLLQQHLFKGGLHLRISTPTSTSLQLFALHSSTLDLSTLHAQDYYPTHRLFQRGSCFRCLEDRNSALSASCKTFCFHALHNVRSSFKICHPLGRQGVRCAATKQTKKKLRAKKVAKRGKGLEFEEMMILWDDVFGKFCEDSEKVEVLRSVAQDGLQAHGRGCVLVHLAGRILPRGAGRGFLSSSKALSSTCSEDPPPYGILQWAAAYLPREFIIDPMKAIDGAADTDFASSSASTDSRLSEIGAKSVPVIGRKMLLRVLRECMDKTRLLSLTGTKRETMSSSAESSVELGFDVEAAGGEQPYEPSKDEMVFLLAVDFGGSPMVGADVVQAFLDAHVSGDAGDSFSWKLKLRDSENLPF